MGNGYLDGNYPLSHHVICLMKTKSWCSWLLVFEITKVNLEKSRSECLEHDLNLSLSHEGIGAFDMDSNWRHPSHDTHSIQEGVWDYHSVHDWTCEWIWRSLA